MKKLFIVGSLLAAAISANASYLCWQVSSGDKGISDVQAWAAESEGNWDYAKITIKTGGDDIVASVYNAAYGTGGAATAPVQINLGDVTSASGWSYYIELANSTSKTVYGSQSGTYADMSASVYQNALDPTDIPSMQAFAWHGSEAGYKATPEPTSAMLMLLGVAGLALRRKQRKA